MSISDPNFPIRYDNLFTEENVGLSLFQRMEQTKELAMEKRLETLLRLMVFAPYANATPQQWKSLVPSPEGLTYIQNVAVGILNAQMDYQALATRKDLVATRDEYMILFDKFMGVDDLSRVNRHWVDDVAPIASVIYFNYLGLTCSRIAGFYPEGSQEKIGILEKASLAFDASADFEVTCSDSGFPVWLGYADFNLARVHQALGNGRLALQGMESAIMSRQQCAEQHPLLPTEVVAGLCHEYFYAAIYGAVHFDAEEPLFVRGVKAYDVWAADKRAAKPDGDLPAHMEAMRAKIILPPARPADPAADASEILKT